jgi:hypothetical protein
MTDDSVVQEFHALVREANCVEEAEGVPVDGAFEAVLSHVASHPESRTALASAFLTLVRDNFAIAVVEYCMHELRWPEVRSVCATWLDEEPCQRTRYRLEGVLQSFDDKWFWRKLYQRYSGTL